MPAGAAVDVAATQSLMGALAEAFGHRSYVLLVLGFFTCGFQLAFITVHLPSYLVDRGLSATVGGWTLATIGLFNIVGSVGSGWLCDSMPKRYLLSIIYFTRAAAILAFISFPATPLTCIAFGAAIGVVWLSAVPPTNGIIALMFGTRWLGTLAGFASSAIRSAVSWARGWAASCSTVPALTIPCGGCRSCSACSRR